MGFSRESWRRCRCHGEGRMALTGRVAFATAAGALLMLAVAVAAAMPSAATRTVLFAMAVFDGVVVACVVADIALAAKVRPLRMVRAGDTMVRLGESATVTITIENPGR